MTVPYVHSNYARRENDDYPTIDTRCVDGLMSLGIVVSPIVDVCSPSGSAIVDYLDSLNYIAIGVGDAFGEIPASNWIVTNTPYKKNEVNSFIERQVERIKAGEVLGAAFLLRTNFDHAKTRKYLFEHPLYYGQIKLCFRPYWTVERKHSPIHNYVWHIWSASARGFPKVWYY